MRQAVYFIAIEGLNCRDAAEVMGIARRWVRMGCIKVDTCCGTRWLISCSSGNSPPKAALRRSGKTQVVASIPTETAPR
jgi:hypothetical protein